MAQEPRPHVAGGSSCAIHIVNFLGTYQKCLHRDVDDDDLVEFCQL
jgi:hypothetical protein